MEKRLRNDLQGFELSPPEGKDTVQEMVDFQLAKKRDAASPERLDLAPMEVA